MGKIKIMKLAPIKTRVHEMFLSEKNILLILNILNMNLKNLNVVELDAQEAKEVEGGFLPLLVIGAALILTGCAAQKPLHIQAQNNRDSINANKPK